MDFAVAISNTVVVGIAAALLHWLNRGQIGMLKEQLAGLRTDMRDEFGRVRGEIAQARGEIGEVRGEIGEVRSEMAIMRSDLTHVALAVGARREPNAG